MITGAAAAAIAYHFKAILLVLHNAGLNNANVYEYLLGMVADWYTRINL